MAKAQMKFGASGTSTKKSSEAKPTSVTIKKTVSTTTQKVAASPTTAHSTSAKPAPVIAPKPVDAASVAPSIEVSSVVTPAPKVTEAEPAQVTIPSQPATPTPIVLTESEREKLVKGAIEHQKEEMEKLLAEKKEAIAAKAKTDAAAQAAADAKAKTEARRETGSGPTFKQWMQPWQSKAALGVIGLVTLLSIACCFSGRTRLITNLPPGTLPPIPVGDVRTNGLGTNVSKTAGVETNSTIIPPPPAIVTSPVPATPTPIPAPVINTTPGSEVDVSVTNKPAGRLSNLPLQQIRDVEVHSHIHGANNNVYGVYNEADKIVDASLRKLLLSQLSQVDWPGNAKPNFETTLSPRVSGEKLEVTIPVGEYWKYNVPFGWRVRFFYPLEFQGTFVQEINGYIVGPTTPLHQEIRRIGWWNKGNNQFPFYLVLTQE